MESSGSGEGKLTVSCEHDNEPSGSLQFIVWWGNF